MTERVAPQVAPPAPVAIAGVASGALQRKCDCGNHTVSGGSCEQCRKKRAAPGGALMRYAAGDAPDRVAGFALTRPGDALEREADDAAARIVGPGPMPDLSPAQDDVAGGGGSADALVASVLQSAGEPLPGEVRRTMEQGFGQDFSDVRVHRGADAARASAAVGAQAYAVGERIVFGRDQFRPGSRSGQRLLAHELAHVLQQRNGRGERMLARETPAADPTCVQGRKPGESLKVGNAPTPSTPAYKVWGTWQPGDSFDSFVRRSYTDWIRWRFAGINGQQSSAVLTYAIAQTRRYSTDQARAGCQYFLSIDFAGLSEMRRLSGEPGREIAAKKAAEGAGGGQGGGDAPAAAAPGADVQAPQGKTAGDPAKADPTKTGGLPSIGDFGPLSDAVAEDRYQDQYATTRIVADVGVLQDPGRAELYLQILQHYTGRPIAAEDSQAATDGLSEAEVEKIVDGKPMRKALTALFGQGYREFERAGGSDRDKFRILIQVICEQFTFGNPTATHNQLKIGKGIPEQDILGIVERGTGILLYNDLGVALPSFGGVGTRDRGYISTKVVKHVWSIDINKVGDPGLRALLNSLRLTFGEPTRMAVAGAEVYFNNIELVNAKVQAGLLPEIKQKFLDMLPFFVGFIAGHAVSSFLMRVPNPQVAAVGAALKALLVGAGYIMDIEFAAGAMERLLTAAALLSKFERDEANNVTKLSESNLNAAAKVIQDMVAEIAVLFATMALGRLLSGAHKGLKRLKIECTHCDLKGPDAVEAKAEGKAEPKAEPKAEAKPEAKPEAKSEAKEPTQQEKAQKRLDELGEQRTKERAKLDEIQRQKEALEKQHKEAIAEFQKAHQDFMQAQGEGSRAAAERLAAARANMRAIGEQINGLDGSNRQAVLDRLNAVEAQMRVESIKADPKSRALLPCFAPDTPVWTEHGLRAIVELRAGDRVWAFDFGRGERRLCAVLQMREGRTDGFRVLVTDRGTVRATSRHRFWVETDLAWRTADSLAPGVSLRGPDGERLRLLANEPEATPDAITCNLSIDECQTFYVGPGALVHNEPVDVGLGGSIIIYRATNPAYPGQVYIGKSTELDARGRPRGAEVRTREHQYEARDALAKHRAGIERLSPQDVKFFEFKQNATLEVLVKGIATTQQADYLEQRNIELDRQVFGEDNVLNRREQITRESRMKEIVEGISKDPAVREKGYCI